MRRHRQTVGQRVREDAAVAYLADDEVAVAPDEELSDPATVRLVRAFASISDPLLKQKAVGIIEAIAETTNASQDGY